MPAAAKPSAAEVAERLAMLETEIASLRSLLKKLKRDTARTDDEAAAKGCDAFAGAASLFEPRA